VRHDGVAARVDDTRAASAMRALPRRHPDAVDAAGGGVQPGDERVQVHVEPRRRRGELVGQTRERERRVGQDGTYGRGVSARAQPGMAGELARDVVGEPVLSGSGGPSDDVR
jgi:hypothetical protein